tara:strand:+ start:352 stop:498 length:147 start_codon:yes stop_codon:yes gene_type:complete
MAVGAGEAIRTLDPNLGKYGKACIWSLLAMVYFYCARGVLGFYDRPAF